MRREVDPDNIYCPQAALVDEELNRKTQQQLERYRTRYYEQRKRHEQNIMLQQLQQQRLIILGLSLYGIKEVNIIHNKKDVMIEDMRYHEIYS